MSSRAIYLLAAFLIFAGCENNRNGNGGETQQATEILEVLRATRGILVERIQSSGVVEGIQEVIVTSEIQGTIDSVLFELGDYVLKNQLMIKIDNEQAVYNLEQAGQELDAARLNLEAVRRLHEQGAASDAELANARSTYNQARAKYESAMEAYENTRIVAPIRGYVAVKESSVTVGNNLTPGMSIGRVVDLSRIRVEIPLGEREVGKIDTGDQVLIIPFSPCPGDSQFYGSVTAIAAGADPATGSFTTVIVADNPCGIALKSGMTVTAVIEISTGDSAIIIPASAVVDSNEVFIFQNGEVWKRKIIKGRTVGNRTEIESGIENGAIVVINPPPGMISGTRVDTVMLGESAQWQ